MAIEDSPLLESLRYTSEFAAFRNDVACRRAVMKRRVEAMRDQLGVSRVTPSIAPRDDWVLRDAAQLEAARRDRCVVEVQSSKIV